MPADSFDPHAVRHRLKLVRNTGATELYANRDGVTCPACGAAFDEALVTSERAHSFDPPAGVSFCFLREDDRATLFTHE